MPTWFRGRFSKWLLYSSGCLGNNLGGGVCHSCPLFQEDFQVCPGGRKPSSLLMSILGESFHALSLHFHVSKVRTDTPPSLSIPVQRLGQDPAPQRGSNARWLMALTQTSGS